MNPNLISKTNRKSVQFTIIVSVILWVLGFLFAPFLMEPISSFLGIKFSVVVLGELITTNISLGSLLGFCAICAGITLVVHSRKQEPSNAVFFSSLLFFLFVAGVRVGIKLLQLKNILQFDFLPESTLSYGILSFFSWGSPYVALATIILVYLIDRRQRRNHSTSSNYE